MPPRWGFTLIELLVVISIVALLGAIVFASVNTARAKTRDARRLSDIHTLRAAMELYANTNRVYPPVVTSRADGWDASYDDGTFMSNLVPNQLPSQVKDPQNNDLYHSYYYRLGNYNSWCAGTPQPSSTSTWRRTKSRVISPSAATRASRTGTASVFTKCHASSSSATLTTQQIRG